MSKTLLKQEINPEIYKVYTEVLDKLYPENLNITQKYAHLQYLQEATRKLHQKYLRPEKQHIEVDYTDHQIQEVYMLRYAIPHALQLPWVLDSLHEADFHRLENNLTASFFGGGPCPEILGLRRYLSKILSDGVNISAANFDICPDWKWHFRANNFCSFRTNLAGNGSDFLDPPSEEWVRNSDLIVIQNCLNEIPDLSCPQLRMNMKYIVDLMKPGALMLVIEKRYSNVEKLLREFHSELTELNEIQTHHTDQDSIDIRYLNYGHVPNELIEHLFQRVRNNWLWLTNNITFHWLAISKQMSFHDPHAGFDPTPPPPPIPMEPNFYDPHAGFDPTPPPPITEEN